MGAVRMYRLVRGCCCKEVYRYPHNNYYFPFFTCISSFVGIIVWIVTGEVGTLQPQLGSTPHSPLRVESDCISGSHSYPLHNGAILSRLLRQNTLDHEPLVGCHLPSPLRSTANNLIP